MRCNIQLITKKMLTLQLDVNGEEIIVCFTFLQIALLSSKPHVYSTETNDKTVTNTEDNEPKQRDVFILDDTIGSELTETDSDVDIFIDSTDIETLTLE